MNREQIEFAIVAAIVAVVFIGGYLFTIAIS